MTTQHTPGWERGYGDAMGGDVFSPPPRGDQNRGVYELGYRAGRHDRFSPVPPRLQHAAPDLLAALELEVEILECEPTLSGVDVMRVARMRAAIAKARGQS